MTTASPEIPGLNVPLALRQLGNNMKLYTKLLDQFQKSYAAAGEEIANSVAAGDYETAERSAHTIKGLAGSLGASALQEVAQKLEKICREHVTGSEFDAALAAFSAEVAATISAIRGFLENGSGEAQPAASAPVNSAVLSSQLASLAAHVNESDARALMLFDEMRAHLEAFDKAGAERIAAAFEVFDFLTASEVIAHLRARLG